MPSNTTIYIIIAIYQLSETTSRKNLAVDRIYLASLFWNIYI